MKTKFLIAGAMLAAAVSLAWVLPNEDVASSGASTTDPAAFNDYWFAGQAELTSYHLKQSRYGENHAGHAVLVFVTEPFNTYKQVKSDMGGGAQVMKCNFTRKFKTGIYPYSMMTSSFLPLETNEKKPLKVTTSSQEWCGHTFTQLNQESDGYRLRQYSYFESEGDEDRLVRGDAIPEDGLWSLIRKDPSLIPVGEVLLIPGTQHLRLRHVPVKPVKAEITVKPRDGMQVLHVAYHGINREVTITFKPEFPYEIQGWEERVSSGFGSQARELVTTARINKRIRSDYWNHNSNADAHMRKELGLD